MKFAWHVVIKLETIRLVASCTMDDLGSCAVFRKMRNNHSQMWVTNLIIPKCQHPIGAEAHTSILIWRFIHTKLHFKIGWHIFFTLEEPIFFNRQYEMLLVILALRHIWSFLSSTVNFLGAFFFFRGELVTSVLEGTYHTNPLHTPTVSSFHFEPALWEIEIRN